MLTSVLLFAAGSAFELRADFAVSDYTVTSFAGNPGVHPLECKQGKPETICAIDGTGTDAQFEYPASIEPLGGGCYLVGQYNNIRKVCEDGTVTTVVAVTDYPEIYADSRWHGFNTIWAIRTCGGRVFFGDQGSTEADPNFTDRVWELDTTTWQATIVQHLGAAGQPNTENRAMACDEARNQLLIATYYYIEAMDLTTFAFTRLVGQDGANGFVDGDNSQALLYYVYGMDVIGDAVYLSDYQNKAIRKVDLVSPLQTSTVISPIPGNGSPLAIKALSDDYLLTFTQTDYKLKLVDIQEGTATNLFFSGLAWAGGPVFTAPDGAPGGETGEIRDMVVLSSGLCEDLDLIFPDYQTFVIRRLTGPSLIDCSTDEPTYAPTNVPTDAPTDSPTTAPTDSPTDIPTFAPTDIPTFAPTDMPTCSDPRVQQMCTELSERQLCSSCDSAAFAELCPSRCGKLQCDDLMSGTNEPDCEDDKSQVHLADVFIIIVCIVLLCFGLLGCQHVKLTGAMRKTHVGRTPI